MTPPPGPGSSRPRFRRWHHYHGGDFTPGSWMGPFLRTLRTQDAHKNSNSLKSLMSLMREKEPQIERTDHLTTDCTDFADETDSTAEYSDRAGLANTRMKMTEEEEEHDTDGRGVAYRGLDPSTRPYPHFTGRYCMLNPSVHPSVPVREPSVRPKKLKAESRKLKHRFESVN